MYSCVVAIICSLLLALDIFSYHIPSPKSGTRVPHPNVQPRYLLTKQVNTARPTESDNTLPTYQDHYRSWHHGTLAPTGLTQYGPSHGAESCHRPFRQVRISLIVTLQVKSPSLSQGLLISRAKEAGTAARRVAS